MKMKLSDKNKKSAFIILGISVLVLSYFFVYADFTAKTRDAKEEIEVLTEKYNRLYNLNKNKEDYETKTKTYENWKEQFSKKFDKDLAQEDRILSIVKTENENNFIVSQLSLGTVEEKYVFGNIQSIDAAKGAGGIATEDYSAISTTYSITGESTYEDMKKFISDMQTKFGRNIPTNINFSYDASTGNYISRLSFSNYAIKSNKVVEE